MYYIHNAYIDLAYAFTQSNFLKMIFSKFLCIYFHSTVREIDRKPSGR